MKTPKDIKAGLRVGIRTIYDAQDDLYTGLVVQRRKGIIRFRPDDNQAHQLDVYNEQWDRRHPWDYKVHMDDIKQVEGQPIREWANT